ncbi:hypothetical protein N7478_007927 [Penicillium angulare]|uniref:uncharacterized protein n=1 Tax=Penicillium angulare TaxID=116970 RepID=UPI00253FA786|nr:uncharacterized protein N7478_007927 [Penicillium angulare]KAJ5272802.1 hypothetical protein N7478_007927 [Penicillium angulare]
MPPPDADLFPEASGTAKPLVDQHRVTRATTQTRVWVALEEKQIPYEYIEVNPYNKPDSLLSLNPKGLIPTLPCPTQQGHKPLYESTVVLEYLEEANPDNQPHLLPQDPYERARARIWIDCVTSKIIPSFHRFLQYQPQNDEEKEAGLAKVRDEFVNHMKVWTKRCMQKDLSSLALRWHFRILC